MSSEIDVAFLTAAFRAGSEERLPGDLCPEPERLWSAARGGLDAEARRRVIDHTARCPACAEDFRIAAELAAAAPEEARVLPFRRLLAPRWLGALAAAAVLVLVVAFGWRFGDGGAPPAHRAGAEAEVTSLLAEGGLLPPSDPRLRWRGPEGARYDVVVTTRELEVVAVERDLAASEMRLPEAVLASRPAGTVLHWQVDATLPDGRRLSSPTFDAVLGPEP